MGCSKSEKTEAEKAAEWATAIEENPSTVCKTSSGYAESNGRPGRMGHSEERDPSTAMGDMGRSEMPE